MKGAAHLGCRQLRHSELRARRVEQILPGRADKKREETRPRRTQVVCHAAATTFKRRKTAFTRDSSTSGLNGFMM